MNSGPTGSATVSSIMRLISLLADASSAWTSRTSTCKLANASPRIGDTRPRKFKFGPYAVQIAVATEQQTDARMPRR